MAQGLDLPVCLPACPQVPFYRPNLHFSVIKRPSRAYEALVEYIWCDRLALMAQQSDQGQGYCHDSLSL
jgi:hypothetical protein